MSASRSTGAGRTSTMSGQRIVPSDRRVELAQHGARLIERGLRQPSVPDPLMGSALRQHDLGRPLKQHPCRPIPSGPLDEAALLGLGGRREFAIAVGIRDICQFDICRIARTSHTIPRILPPQVELCRPPGVACRYHIAVADFVLIEPPPRKHVQVHASYPVVTL